MGTGLNGPLRAMPIQQRQSFVPRKGVARSTSDWLDLKERIYKGLLIAAPVLVFLVVFAWDWMPWNAPEDPPALSPAAQQLVAMDQEAMRQRVWPSSPETIEAAQPQFGSRPIGDLISIQFDRCGSGQRITCVVDGDTFWYKGEKVRIADIDTPEISVPACQREAQVGEQAAARLIALLNQAPFSLETDPQREYDDYGRRLLKVTRNGNSVGNVLVREGLAERWGGRSIDWCSA